MFFSHQSPLISSSLVVGSVTESPGSSCLNFLRIFRRMTCIYFSPLVLGVQHRLVLTWGVLRITVKVSNACKGQEKTLFHPQILEMPHKRGFF